MPPRLFHFHRPAARLILQAESRLTDNNSLMSMMPLLPQEWLRHPKFPSVNPKPFAQTTLRTLMHTFLKTPPRALATLFLSATLRTAL
jgi:hypothetical protein